jgi:hypothetical protein
MVSTATKYAKAADNIPAEPRDNQYPTTTLFLKDISIFNTRNGINTPITTTLPNNGVLFCSSVLSATDCVHPGSSGPYSQLYTSPSIKHILPLLQPARMFHNIQE